AAWALEQSTRPRKVGRSIDTERDSVNEPNMNAHTGLQRSELLELLPELEPRRRERYEARQCLPPVSIDADMMIERPLAIRRSSAGEIEGAQHRPTFQRRPHHLHHIRIGALLLPRDGCGDGSNIGVVLGERGKAAP